MDSQELFLRLLELEIPCVGVPPAPEALGKDLAADLNMLFTRRILDVLESIGLCGPRNLVETALVMHFREGS